MRIETPARLPACAGKWHPEERLWLQQFLEAIAADYRDAVKKVVLYGSKARGDWHDESDIDVLVIVRNEEAVARTAVPVARDELPGDETMTRWTLAAALLALLMAPTPGMAQDAGAVRSAHEDLEPGTRTDDLGITIGIPASHPARRYPASHEFPTGPAIGERLPEFALPNQRGRVVDYHADRGDSKSIVVFYRSAVW